MNQCVKFILFWNDTLHVADGLSVHHREFKTVHTAAGLCQTDTADCLLVVKGWGESVSTVCVGKTLETVYSTFLSWCCVPFQHVVF